MLCHLMLWRDLPPGRELALGHLTHRQPDSLLHLDQRPVTGFRRWYQILLTLCYPPRRQVVVADRVAGTAESSGAGLNESQ